MILSMTIKRKRKVMNKKSCNSRKCKRGSKDSEKYIEKGNIKEISGKNMIKKRMTITKSNSSKDFTEGKKCPGTIQL